MLKSLAAKLTGLGAAGMVACALAAHPATASAIKGPPCSGPFIERSGSSIIGSCFAPESTVSVLFFGYDGVADPISKYETTFASITGTISVPILWTKPCQTDDAMAYVAGVESNVVPMSCFLEIAPSGK